MMPSECQLGLEDWPGLSARLLARLARRAPTPAGPLRRHAASPNGCRGQQEKAGPVLAAGATSTKRRPAEG